MNNLPTIEYPLDPPDPQPTAYGIIWLGCYDKGYEAGLTSFSDCKNPYKRTDFKDAWEIGYAEGRIEQIVIMQRLNALSEEVTT